MENNKRKRLVTIILSIVLGFILILVIFGVGVHIGSQGREAIILKQLSEEDESPYTEKDLIGAWVAFDKTKDGAIKLGHISYYGKADKEDELYNWSFTGLDLEDKSQYVDIKTLIKEQGDPTYIYSDMDFDKKSNIYTYTYDLFGEEQDKNFYFETVIGKDFRIISNYSEDMSRNLQSNRLYKLKQDKDGYYIDIDEIKYLASETITGSVNRHNGAHRMSE